MDAQKEFSKIMKTSTEIALATSVDDIANVRIVNFYFDELSKTLFFASFADNEKVKEIVRNEKAAFTTIPKYNFEHVKAKGEVRQSKLNIYDVEENFVRKIPGYEEIIEKAGEFLLLFELKFSKATVVLDYENTGYIDIL